MKYRWTTILEREVHADNITKIIDLNLIDPVSQIVVIHEPYNSASGAQTAHPAKCISKIELVDGSDVLHSLSGVETQALDWYHRLVEPQNYTDYLPTRYAKEHFVMNFGRKLWDTMLAFDPKHFKSPQLKVTIDVDGGGSTVTTGYLTVLAALFDEKMVTPIGLLMSKELKDYAMGSSAHEYTDLPVDFPFRKLLARAQVYGTGPSDCFDTIKLSEDSDKKIPVNMTIAQILSIITGQTPAFKEHVLHEGSATAYSVYIAPTQDVLLEGTQWRSTASQAFIAYLLAEGGRATFDQYSETSNTQLLAMGYCPHGVIEIPFGDQEDPDDWYDPAALRSLILDIKAGSGMSSSNSCQIFAQQLRKY